MNAGSEDRGEADVAEMSEEASGAIRRRRQVSVHSARVPLVGSRRRQKQTQTRNGRQRPQWRQERVRGLPVQLWSCVVCLVCW